MKKRSKVDMQAYVEHDDTVFLVFYDKNLSQSVHLTPEQAIEIGAVGNMAKARMEARNAENVGSGVEIE